MKTKPKDDVTEAIHLQHEDGTTHVVAVKALHVLLVPDGDGWFAQGLEIDYAASGATVDDVKQNFADGLKLTVHEHLRVFGDIEKILVMAPSEAWAEYLAAPPKAIKQSLTSVQIHQLLGDVDCNQTSAELDDFPFDEIQFIKPGVIANVVGEAAIHV